MNIQKIEDFLIVRFLLKTNMIIVDIETTGLNPEKCGIASIGAVDFKNPENQFYVEPWVSRDTLISEEALKINGFTREQLFDLSKYCVCDCLKQFFSWASKDIEDMTLAGENVAFDANFLEANARMSNLPWIFGHRYEDLHTLSRQAHRKIGVQLPIEYNRSALSLDETLKFVGLPIEPKPHNGLTGAKLEAEAFSRLINKSVLLPEYASYKIPRYLLNGGARI